MLSALSVLARRPMLVVSIVLLAAALVQTWRLGQATDALQVERAEHASTRTLLAAQAAGVAEIERKAKQVREAGQKAVARAEQRAVQAEQRARSIEQSATPQTCEAAIEFLVEDARGAQ